MNHLQLYRWVSGCSNMELFRELLSIHTGAPFTTARFLSLTCMLQILYTNSHPHTQRDMQYTQLHTEHLLGSVTLASATDVTDVWLASKVTRGAEDDRGDACFLQIFHM